MLLHRYRSWSPRPVRALEVCIAIELVAKPFRMAWQEGRRLDSICTIQPADKCLHALAGADNEARSW
jgi:hypothetical protein